MITIDERLRNASAAVHRAVADAEPPTALEQTQRRRRSSRRASLLVGATAAACLVLIGMLAVVQRRGDDSDQVTVGSPPAPTAAPTTSTTITRVIRPVGHSNPPTVVPLPGGAPPDPAVSKSHPVVVSPAIDLRHGQIALVSGREFPPAVELNILMCTSGAYTKGPAACDIMSGISAHTDDQGNFTVPFQVNQHVWFGHDSDDCAEGTVDPNDYLARRDAGQSGFAFSPDIHAPVASTAPWTCFVVAALGRDTTESGGFPVRFDPIVPSPESQHNAESPLDTTTGCARALSEDGVENDPLSTAWSLAGQLLRVPPCDPRLPTTQKVGQACWTLDTPPPGGFDTEGRCWLVSSPQTWTADQLREIAGVSGPPGG